MFLNEIKPALGSRKNSKRVGRGIGSTLGKTCGRGHKGQKSRSGGFHKVGFEGGQMPLQRRLPKVGFTSKIKKYSSQIRLHELELVTAEVIDIQVLIDANLIPSFSKSVKVILSGEITKPVTLKGIKVTVGAKNAIKVAGGTIEE